MSSLRRLCLRLLLYVAVPCLCLASPTCLSLMSLFPSRGFRQTPEDLRLPHESVQFSNAFGRRLHGWYIPAEKPQGSVVLFHGNAGNMGDFLVYAQLLHKRGFNALLMDYQGFGQSQGSATVLSLEADGLAGCDWMLGRQPPGGKIAVMGVSLGTTVALAVAAQRESVAGVVLEGSFIPRAELRKKVGTLGLPLAAIIQTAIPRGLDAAARIDKLAGRPVLFIHGGRDRTTHLESGAGLYEAAPGPRWMWVLPEQGHFPEPIDTHPELYEPLLCSFLESLFTQAPFIQPQVEWTADDGRLRAVLRCPVNGQAGRIATVTICGSDGVTVRKLALTGPETTLDTPITQPPYSVSAMCLP
jgi:fermentation-respiration switch protein FrsA (DUF1100 family)